MSYNHNISLYHSILIKDKIHPNSIKYSTQKELLFLLTLKGNIVVFDKLGNFLISFSSRIISGNQYEKLNTNLNFITSYNICENILIFSCTNGNLTMIAVITTS